MLDAELTRILARGPEKKADEETQDQLKALRRVLLRD